MLQINALSFWERKGFFEDLDFVIIGSGIVGYTTAFNLRLKYPKAKILILERGYLPSGASTKNAGFTCFGSPTEIKDDLMNIPESEVWKTIAMRFEGLKELFSYVEGYDIGYEKNGSWDLIKSGSQNQNSVDQSFIDYLNINCEKYFGVNNIYSIDKESFNSFGFLGIKESYYNKEEGQIDTGKLNQVLNFLAVKNQIYVLNGVELIDYTDTTNHVELITNIGSITCSKLIFCSNGFAGKFLQNEVKPARAQVLVTSEIKNLPFKGTFHMECGYYYFRNIGKRVLLGGGRNLDFEGETTTELDVTENIQSSLKTLLNNTILPNHSFTIDYQWAGIMGVGDSKSPIIRLQSKNVAFGVRMGGMGVAIGSLVGKKIAQLF